MQKPVIDRDMCLYSLCELPMLLISILILLFLPIELGNGRTENAKGLCYIMKSLGHVQSTGNRAHCSFQTSYPISVPPIKYAVSVMGFFFLHAVYQVKYTLFCVAVLYYGACFPSACKRQKTILCFSRGTCVDSISL